MRKFYFGRMVLITMSLVVSALVFLPVCTQAADERLVIKDDSSVTTFAINKNGELGFNDSVANPMADIDLGGGTLTLNGTDTTGSLVPQFSWIRDGMMLVGFGSNGGANFEMYSSDYTPPGTAEDRDGVMAFVFGGGEEMGDLRFTHYTGTTYNVALRIQPKLVTSPVDSSTIQAYYMGLGVRNPVYPIQVGEFANNARLLATGNWATPSSREYKENIADLSAEEAVQTLKALKPVKYNYKNTPDEEYIGFIAEDVPSTVSMNDRKSLIPMDFLAVAVKVLQQQQEKIEQLAERVEYLEGKMFEQNPKLVSLEDVEK